MKIAKLSDRFIIKLGEISVEVSPMSGRDKITLAGFAKYEGGKYSVDKAMQEHFVIKHTVKDIKGVTDFNGDEYKLSFSGDRLTDECADEVLGLLASTWFSPAWVNLSLNGPGKLISPVTGEPVEGVEVILKGDVGEVEEGKK